MSSGLTIQEKLDRELSGVGIAKRASNRGLQREIRCSECGKVERKTMSNVTPPGAVVNAFKKAGWRPGKKPQCPDCHRGHGKPKKAEGRNVLSLNLDKPKEEPVAEETKTTNPFHTPGSDVSIKMSIVYQASHHKATILCLGMPKEFDWNTFSVEVNEKQSHLILTKDGEGYLRHLPRPTKPSENAFLWIKLHWSKLGLPDPKEKRFASVVDARVYNWNSKLTMSVPIPGDIQRMVRGVSPQQREAFARISTKTAKQKWPDDHEKLIQDCKDARDILNDAVRTARKAGIEITTTVEDDDCVGLRRWVRYEEDL